MRWLFFVLAAVSLLLPTLFVFSLNFKYEFFNKTEISKEITFKINSNETLTSVANRLKNEKLIFDSKLFQYGARFYRFEKKLRYGEFVLNNNMSIRDILTKITSNESITYNVFVRECLTSWEILEHFKKQHFLINDLSETKIAEGVFSPNTYTVSFNTRFSDLLILMRQEQDNILEEEWNGRAKNLPLKNKYELLVLASIIEKESANFDEMSLISSVFINRLNKRMRLQSDPTVSYGIDNGNTLIRRVITKNDLQQINSHNTYRFSGLPSSPICNPGKSAIHAAANPTNTDYLYFVMSDSGNHLFEETFEKHKNNVVKWRKSKK